MFNKLSPVRERITPAIPFTLKVEDADGNKFELLLKLAYDLNGLTLYEEQMGRSMLTDALEAITDYSVKNISLLFWAALQINHEDEFGGVLGLVRVRKNLTLSTLRPALAGCIDAYFSQLPAEQAERLRKAMDGEKPADPPKPVPAAAA